MALNMYSSTTSLTKVAMPPWLGFPKEGYVVFVCATGARAAEMYFGLMDDCKYKDSKRLFFLDADVAYTPKGPVVQ